MRKGSIPTVFLFPHPAARAGCHAAQVCACMGCSAVPLQSTCLDCSTSASCSPWRGEHAFEMPSPMCLRDGNRAPRYKRKKKIKLYLIFTSSEISFVEIGNQLHLKTYSSQAQRKHKINYQKREAEQREEKSKHSSYHTSCVFLQTWIRHPIRHQGLAVPRHKANRLPCFLYQPTLI